MSAIMGTATVTRAIFHLNNPTVFAIVVGS
jgi:hypothetical protein